MESSTESHPSSAVVAGAIAADAERIRRARRATDAWLLGISVLVVVASMILTPSTQAGRSWAGKFRRCCLFSNLTGLDCFGCGLTRSFTFLGHGDLKSALDLHRLGPILYALVLSQIPFRMWCLWKSRAIGTIAADG